MITKGSRKMCDAWFSSLNYLGYDYDITSFTDWNFDWTTVNFNFEEYIVKKPSIQVEFGTISVYVNCNIR